jgi:hypothetical protein
VLRVGIPHFLDVADDAWISVPLAGCTAVLNEQAAEPTCELETRQVVRQG